MAHKAVEIADFLVEQAIQDQYGDLLTNLKLQKLLYYAEGCHLAVSGESLFQDKIEAWEMGPVVPDVYHRFKPCGRQPIEAPFSESGLQLSGETKDFLVLICEKFGRFSASQLVAMTHKEEPWITAYGRSKNAEIAKSTIKNFFVLKWKAAVEECERDIDEYDPIFADALRDALKEVDGRNRGMSADDLLVALNIQ